MNGTTLTLMLSLCAALVTGICRKYYANIGSNGAADGFIFNAVGGGVPAKYSLLFAVYGGYYLWCRRRSPLGKQMGHFKIFYPRFFCHGDPFFKQGKIKRIFTF